MDLRTKLMRDLEESRAAMLVHLTQVNLQRKIYPLWTIREILAHISGWDDSVIAVIECLRDGSVPTTPAREGVDAYNAATVTTREGLDYDHVYREYIETRKILLGMLAELDDARLAETTTLPWGGYGTVEQIIGIFVEHEIEHAGDVQKIVAAAQIKPAA